MAAAATTAPSYGNSTRSLTLKAIEVALTKDQTGNNDVGRKKTKEGANKGISKYSEIL
jgi:hypothetical protein